MISVFLAEIRSARRNRITAEKSFPFSLDFPKSAVIPILNSMTKFTLSTLSDTAHLGWRAHWSVQICVKSPQGQFFSSHYMQFTLAWTLTNVPYTEGGSELRQSWQTMPIDSIFEENEYDSASAITLIVPYACAYADMRRPLNDLN